MATNYLCGFESGSLSAEPVTAAALSATVGSVALDTGTVRTGTYSLKLTPASGANGYWDATNTALATTAYIRFYLRVTTLPGTARMVFGTITANHTNLLLNTNGTLALRIATVTSNTSTTALTDTSKWYRIDVKNTAGSQELRIDGVSEATGTSANPSVALRFGAHDTVAATYTAYVDDIARNGANYPVDGKEVLLVPISDNARDTLWTGGAGGTSNLFAAVDNIPPTGTATETDSTQIEHAGGAAGTTDRYDANMTTYTTAGIASGDTINAINAWCVHGEDSGTGTKNLNIEGISNPAIAVGGDFTVGNDVGALGTFPSNWVPSVGIYTDAPSVTLGTSPVMRVRRPETASRVASVCFMGMYVDYTPATGVASAPIGGLALLGVGR